MPQIPDRVLIIAPTPFFADRGCHIHIAEQAWALQRKNIKTLMVTYGLGRDVDGIRTIRTWRLPWYKQEAIGPSWHKFYLDIFLFFTALLAAWRFRPQVIHGHLHEGCLIGWGISRLTGIPFVFDCQGSLTGELIAHNFILTKPAIFKRVWYAIERVIDRLPDIILAQSTEMRRELIEHFKIDPNRIVMAYDGVNTHVFHPQQKDPQLLQELKLPANLPIIVYLGGLSPHKGVDTLLKAFQVVLSTHPDAYLLLMGYPHEADYQRLAQSLRIDHRLRITGRVKYEDAPRYLALGDIAVAPKRTQTEANGKIYNYMAAGLPTVAFDTVVNRDILGDLGVYTNPADDYHGLARALNALLENPAAARVLAGQVRTKSVSLYSWDNVASRIISAYRQVQTPWQLQVFQVSIRKQAKWRWLHRAIAPHLHSHPVCLDVGSGVGTLSFLQEKLGGQWTFIETDPAAAEQTKAIVQGQVITSDIYDPALQPDTYHVITILDVIEHVTDPDRFLRRVRELLRPGGHAFITTPADNHQLYFFRFIGDKFFHIDRVAHGHTRDGYSRPELGNSFSASHLTVVNAIRFSKSFTELIELAYNTAYKTLNTGAPSTTGYNLTLSPASQHDFIRHQKFLPLLKITHPLLLGLSLLDDLLPDSFGYEWGIVVKK